MSVDKIGNVDKIVITNHAQAHHRLQKTQIKDSIDTVGEAPAKISTTKISDPPFFPVGDTQSIYKK